jgi:methionyl-tRNA formyltransferase
MRPTTPSIVFFGSSDTGWACCHALLEAGIRVSAVVTQRRQFEISWARSGVTNVRHRDLGELAARYGVPAFDASAGSQPLRERLAGLAPDLLVVVGWYHMMARSLRETARLGAIGVHASLLPELRGGAPLVWAVIEGRARTGVTLFHLTDDVDAGDVIAQEAFPINQADTIAEVIVRANAVAVGLVRAFVPRVIDGSAPRTPQDHLLATYRPQRGPEDGALNWTTLTADAAYDWVRAQTRPYPGAFTVLDGARLNIWKTSRPVSLAATLAPGTIVREGEQLSVVCADGRALHLLEVSVEGTPATAVHDPSHAI